MNLKLLIVGALMIYASQIRAGLILEGRRLHCISGEQTVELVISNAIRRTNGSVSDHIAYLFFYNKSLKVKVKGRQENLIEGYGENFLGRHGSNILSISYRDDWNGEPKVSASFGQPRVVYQCF